MINKPGSYISTRILLGVVALLLVLSFIPVPEGPLIEVLFQKAGIGVVNSTASQYLEKQREQALEGFLVLSALKVGLAVLRSSEIGLILNVRIGDVAIAVYDYVNFAWKVLLAAVAYYYLAQFLLDLASTVDIWFVWIVLVCSFLVLSIAVFRIKTEKPTVFFKKTGLAAAVFAFILYLGLPLAFVGAGWVSVHITGSTIEDANRVFQELEDSMPGILEGERETGTGQPEIRTPSVTVPVPYDGKDPTQAVIDNSTAEKNKSQTAANTGLKERLIRLRGYLKARSRSLASAVLRQTAAYLFNIVVFPLLTILLLYWSGKYFLSLGSQALSFVPDSEVSRHIRHLSAAVARLEKAAADRKSGNGPPDSPGSGKSAP